MDCVGCVWSNFSLMALATYQPVKVSRAASESMLVEAEAVPFNWFMPTINGTSIQCSGGINGIETLFITMFSIDSRSRFILANEIKHCPTKSLSYDLDLTF